MKKLLLTPDAESYQSADGKGAIYIALQGGAGRSRTDVIGSAKSVTCSWTMNPVQYQYWRAFYRTATKEGALPFLCDMLSEDGLGAVEHICQFIPGSVTVPSQRGLTYVQQAQLEVLPLPVNEADDNSVISLFEISAGQSDLWYRALEKLANVTIPGAEAFNA